MIKNEKLLKEFREKPCELCGITDGIVVHHRLSKLHGSSRMDVPENLASLCFYHHTWIHSSKNQTDRMFGEGTYDSFHQTTNGLSRYELERKYNDTN